MSDSPYTSIPDLFQDNSNLQLVLSAMKQNLEVLTGQRGPVGGGAATVFMANPDAGDKVPVGVNAGDFWIQYPIKPTDAWKISIWFAAKWNKL